MDTKNIKSIATSLLLIASLFQVVAIAHPGHDGEPAKAEYPGNYMATVLADIRNVYTEPGSSGNNASVLNDIKHEYIDTFSGILQLQYVDIAVPANGGLNIVAQRNYLGIQPHQFELMTAMQRDVNGLGWHSHYGKLVSSSLNSESICRPSNGVVTPLNEFTGIVTEMINDLEDGSLSELEQVQRRITAMKSLLSRKATFTFTELEELEGIAIQAVHDLQESIDGLGLDAETDQYDLSDIISGNDTNLKELMVFFKDIVSGFSIPFYTRDNIAFEMPDGSRRMFFRDGVANDGSLISLERMKLRCDGNDMVVTMPNGTQYRMTEYERFIGQRQPSEYSKHLYWGEHSWFVTQIKDLHDNQLSINYSESDDGLKYITSTVSGDPNAASLNYRYEASGQNTLRLESIESAGRTWRYAYATVTRPSRIEGDADKEFNVLTSVTRPDGRVITYDYDPVTFQLVKYISAYGAVVDYAYQDVDILPDFPSVNSPFRLYSALSTKTVSGLDIETVNWSFEFAPNSVQPADVTPGNANRQLNYDLTTITGPYAKTQYYHYSGHPIKISDNEYTFWSGELQSLSLASNRTATSAEDTSQLVAGQTYRARTPNEKVSNHSHFNGASLVDYLSIATGDILFQSNAHVYLPRVTSRYNSDSFSLNSIEGGALSSFVTQYADFDEYGFPTTVVEPLSGILSNNSGDRRRAITYKHDPQKWLLGLLVTQTVSDDENSLIIQNTYSENGLLSSSNVSGVQTTYTYLDNGELSTVTDAKGHKTEFHDYKNGQPTRIVNAENETTLLSVNATGTVANMTDAEGNLSRYEYDSLNRPVLLTPPTNAPTSITYSTDEFVQTSKRGGLTTKQFFDVLGRPIKSTAHDIELTFAYDLANRRVFTSLPNSASGTASSYNAINQMSGQTDPAGETTGYAYGANFSSVTTTNKRGFERTHSYMRYGFEPLLTAIDEPFENDRRITNMAYNFIGAKTVVSQYSGQFNVGQNRLFGYDNRYFLNTVTEPEIGTTKYDHDAVGNVIRSEVNNSGRRTVYEYDKANRLTRVDYPGLTEDISYTYTQNGQLASSQTGRVSNQYSYNENNSLVRESLSINGRFPRTLQLDYDYSALDHLSSITYPNGYSVDYQPDVLGRPIQVGSLASSVEFADHGQLISLNMSNGVSLSKDYDERLLPISITTPGLVDLNYDYDPQGNVASISNAINPTQNVSFGADAYDGLDRLKRVITSSDSVGEVDHAYDALGNLMSIVSGVSSSATNTTYDYASNLRGIKNSAANKPNFSFIYDIYGNVNNKKASTKFASGLQKDITKKNFVFDDASRLLTVNVASAVDQTKSEQRNYYYDAQKYRAISEVPATADVNYSFYSLSGDLMFEESIETCSTVSNVRVGAMLLARQVAVSHESAQDTDGDTINDCLEAVSGLNPELADDAQADNDNDGLSNAEEILEHDTLIDSADSDADGVSDADEVAAGTNPNRADSDFDTISDGDESAYGTDSTEFDTDHDGISDGIEVAAQLEPLDAKDGVLDLDQDSFSNRQEALLGFDPNSNASTPPQQGRKEWEFDGLGMVLSAPSIDSSGRIYYGTDLGNIYAVYPDGTEAWRYQISGSVYGSVGVDEANQSLIFGGSDGFVRVLDFDGQPKWVFDVDEPILGSSAFNADGTIFIASKTRVWSFASNGSPIWQFDLDGETDMRSRVAVSADNKIYVGDSSNTLYTINGETGDLILTRTTSGSVAQAAPAITQNGDVFVMTATGRLHYYSATGSALDSISLSDLDHTPNVFSSPVIASDNTLYIGVYSTPDVLPLPGLPTSSAYQLVAVTFDEQNIFTRWRYDLSGVPSTPTVGADGTIFIADGTGLLHAVGDDGQSKWINDQYPAGTLGSPAIDIDGTLYLAFENGILSAVASTVKPKSEYWFGLGHGGIMSGNQCQFGSVVYDFNGDMDGDGYPDCYEILNDLTFDDPTDGQQDTDGDGLSDGEEYQANTDPNNPDTDGDGISDGDEVSSGSNPLDQEPQVSINKPTANLQTFEGDSIDFDGFANDNEDGFLFNSLIWVSDRDGVIGNGPRFSITTLSVGVHTISASVTDSAGSTQTETVTVTITENSAPVVSIQSPQTNATVELGNTVSFDAVATDAEDGELTAQIAWQSSIDGALGLGGNVTNDSLSLGMHVITASVQDAGGKAVSSTINLLVDYDPSGDADGDGLTNQEEIELGTDPLSKDTDHDGLFDGLEVELDTNPLKDYGEGLADYDDDGFSNRQENYTGQDPLDPLSVPALGSLMWSQYSNVHGYGLALTNDGILHSAGTTFYPDGVARHTPEYELSNGPSVGNSGYGYYPDECQLYKVGDDGKTDLFASYQLENGNGFCSFSKPSINSDESLVVTPTGAGYGDGDYLGFDDQGNLTAKYNVSGSYDFTIDSAIGSLNDVFLFPEDAYSVYGFSSDGEEQWQNFSGYISTFAIDEEDAVYYLDSSIGKTVKVDRLGQLQWESSALSVDSFDVPNLLIGRQNQLFTMTAPNDSANTLYRIDSETGLGEQLQSCPINSLGFIGRNNLIYVTEKVSSYSNASILKACDANGVEVWRSQNESLIGFASDDSFIVTDDGTLLVSQGGSLSAYVTDSRGLSDSVWPKVNRDNRQSNHQPGAVTFNAAKINDPPRGRRITSGDITVTWNDVGAPNYRVEVISDSIIKTATVSAGSTQVTITGVPLRGNPIRIILKSVYHDRIEVDEAVYPSGSEDVSPTAAIQSPVEGTGLNTSAPTFTWNDVGAEKYRFWFGRSVGAKDIKVAWSGAMTTSKIVRGLPLNGSDVYLRFFTRHAGVWTHRDYQYTAHTDAGPLLAELTSPSTGATFNSPHVRFNWSPVDGAQRYRFWFGTVEGAKDIKVAWSGANKSTKQVLDLPLDGSTIHLRFFTKKYDEWRYEDYQFNAHTDLTPQVAELIEPVNNSTWASPHIRFMWQDIGADKYRISIGSQPGGFDVRRVWANSDKTEKLVKSLPHDGRPIYVQLSSKKYGRWKSKDYVFTTHTDPVPDTSELSSHSNGDTLASDTVTFQWSDVDADRNRILVGTTKNGQEIAVKGFRNPTTHEYQVTGLPTDGSTVYVKLVTYKYGVWTNRQYEFTAVTTSSTTN